MNSEIRPDGWIEGLVAKRTAHEAVLFCFFGGPAAMRTGALRTRSLKCSGQGAESQVWIGFVQASTAEDLLLMISRNRERPFTSATCAVQNAVPVLVASRNAAMSSWVTCPGLP